MRDHGNFSQWDGEDAPEHLLPGDIEAGKFICSGRKRRDPCRLRPSSSALTHADAVIEQGAWKADHPRTLPSTASQATVRSNNILGRIMGLTTKSKDIPHTGSTPTKTTRSCRERLKNRDLRDAELSMFRTERRGSRLSGAGNHDADERHRIDHLVLEVSFFAQTIVNYTYITG